MSEWSELASMGMCAMYSFCKYGAGRMQHEYDDDEVYSGGSSSDGGFMVGKQIKGASEASYPALWKRTIPKGRRCEPLDFSGLILYDEHGNSIQSTPTSTRSSIIE